MEWKEIGRSELGQQYPTSIIDFRPRKYNFRYRNYPDLILNGILSHNKKSNCGRVKGKSKCMIGMSAHESVVKLTKDFPSTGIQLF